MLWACEEAQQQPIDCNNKGFTLLAVMGNQEGSALWVSKWDVQPVQP